MSVLLPPGISSPLTGAVRFSMECVQTVCGLALQWEGRENLWRETKPDGSSVTEIDYGAQAFVARQLSSYAPQDLLVAEEDASLLKSNSLACGRVVSGLSGLIPEANDANVISWVEKGESLPGDRYWLLDPVDSTNGLLAGGLYCVNLALVENGRVEVAVIGLPKPFMPWPQMPSLASGYLFVAIRGGGSWWTTLDGSLPLMSLQVSRQKDLTQAIRLRSLARTNPRQSETDSQRRAKVSRAFGESGNHIRCPAPIRYPLLAVGQGDLYVHLDLGGGASPTGPVHHGMKAWDHAAGALLVQEAGGEVTDLDGKALDFGTGRVLSNNRGLLASNGSLHAAALQVLQSIGEAADSEP